jgi:hypothetical protein
LDETNCDKYFEDLEKKYAMSFVFGKDDYWEVYMKRELCRGTGTDPKALPPIPKLNINPDPVMKYWKQYPAARGKTFNLLCPIPEAESEIPGKCDDTISGVDMVVSAHVHAETPKFDFDNDEVIQKEYMERVASESANSADAVPHQANFCVKKLSHADMELDSEDEKYDRAIGIYLLFLGYVFRHHRYRRRK